MSEWKTYKLGDICTKIGSGATPSGGKEAYKGGDYNLVRSQNVLDFSFSCEGLAQINEEQATKLNNVELQANDVLLNITGDSVARTCLVPTYVLPARVNQHVAIVRANKDILDCYYLLYFIQSQKTNLLSLASGGATRNALTKSMIENYEISLPSLSEQKRISSILKSLDDKIENNRKINENLEQQAQALFKSWFIDFEPFKDGKFIDSELGPIPQGWRVGTLGDVMQISKVSINPSKQPQSIFNHFSIPAFDNGMLPEKQFGHEILSNKFKIDENMTLFSKLNPRIKRLWFVGKVPENAICSTEFVPFEANKNDWPFFIKCLVGSDFFYNNAMSLVNGATGSHQRFHPQETLLFTFPLNETVIDKFNRLVQPVILQQVRNLEECQRLSILRDTLLPKLMSGEIEV